MTDPPSVQHPSVLTNPPTSAEIKPLFHEYIFDHKNFSDDHRPKRMLKAFPMAEFVKDMDIQFCFLHLLWVECTPRYFSLIFVISSMNSTLLGFCAKAIPR